jgi:hypothetical protein
MGRCRAQTSFALHDQGGVSLSRGYQRGQATGDSTHPRGTWQNSRVLAGVSAQARQTDDARVPRQLGKT